MIHKQPNGGVVDSQTILYTLLININSRVDMDMLTV